MASRLPGALTGLPVRAGLAQFHQAAHAQHPIVQVPQSPAPPAPHERHARRFPLGSKLHVGCGPRRLAGWVNADAVPGVGDVVVDLHDAGLPSKTFRIIYGCHVLEHCWAQETPTILRRLREALLPGGTLRLSVPDVRLVVRNCVDGQAYGGEESALSVLYGGTYSRSTTAPDLHRQTFWKERLERLLTEAGFVRVREWGFGQYAEIDALGDYATKPRDANNRSLISLNLEADRPGELGQVDRGGAGIDVSILLGTVDRPDMLRDCVEAVRASLTASGYTHEIVVAYGRDDEAALPWMREQRDIVPVAGGMYGAIVAFNRAYAASIGRMICQINDDVVVDGAAIALAMRHLDADPTAAGVVFKFDRGDGNGYRHERVAGTLHPNQMVVRREACEAVVEQIGAFWGDADHRTDKTYGGDTAFGVVCRYLGLRLDSVEGVTCRDRLAPDALRQRNQAAVAPDHSARWRAMYEPFMRAPRISASGNEWPNLYVPRTGMAPRRSPFAAGEPLRMLALPIVVNEWPQTALRAALARVGPYAEVLHDGAASAARTKAIADAARQHRPDVVWFQIQSQGWAEAARALRAAVGPDCTIVQWTGDVRTSGSQPVQRWMPELAPHVDIMLADNCTYARKLVHDERVRAACGYMGHGTETELTWEASAPEVGGAVFFGTNYKSLDGGAREWLFDQVGRQLPGVLSLYGTGWERMPATLRSHPFLPWEQAGTISRQAAVAISVSLFHDLERYTSNRLKCAFAVGAVTAVRAFAGMDGLGLRDGINCLTWETPDQLVALLREWTAPARAGARQKLREAAAELARERFTWARSVEEMLAIVRDYRARRGAP